MTDNERKELLLKAKPILFNNDMVRAILDGRKTVTRRVVKPQPREIYHGGTLFEDDDALVALVESQNGRLEQNVSPYRPGDILYVRETWAELETVHRVPYWAYKADDQTLHHSSGENFERWHPSIHMPKEAARIFLRVTNVRVERLQDITDSECMAEGICSWSKDGKLYKYYLADEEGDYPDCEWSECPKTPQDAMQRIWDSTIKKSDLDRYGWDANPWVWVIEFERID